MFLMLRHEKCVTTLTIVMDTSRILGILKRKTLKRTETSSVLNAVSSILWGGQRSGIDSIDFQTVQIVLGSMVAGVAVGLGVYYWSRRREGTRK